MKWACLKYLDFCLSEASAGGEADKIICNFLSKTAKQLSIT